MANMALVEQIMKMATNTDAGEENQKKYDPDIEKAKERISNIITEWSLSSEQQAEVPNDLPTLEDIHEAYADNDTHRLHEQAVKARLALYELNDKVLSHIRNLMSLTQNIAPCLDEDSLTNELKNAPEFLKGLPPELILSTLQEMLLSEAAGIVFRLTQYDIAHTPTDSNE